MRNIADLVESCDSCEFNNIKTVYTVIFLS